MLEIHIRLTYTENLKIVQLEEICQMANHFFAKFEQYGNLGSAKCTVISKKLLPQHNDEDLGSDT